MKQEIKIPVIGESVTEATIAEWKKQDGSFVKEDEVLCIIESEKATMEIQAETDGQLEIQAASGDQKQIGEVIGWIDTEKKSDVSVEAEPDKTEAAEESQNSDTSVKGEKIFATSVAKQMMEKEGISIETVKGSGEHGRITKQDVQMAIEARQKAAENISETNQETEPQMAEAAPEAREIRKKMTTLRKTIARNLVAVKNETAMLTTINEVDMSAILQMRRELNDDFQKKYDIKLGFMSIFAKAVCLALKDAAIINARVEEDEIVYPQYVNLSIAVSTPMGLVVPVIREAETKNLAQLEQEIQQIAIKARDGKLAIADMSGGTFTITNGGVFGSLISTPIINPPQSAVLGMHTIQERPVAMNGNVVIRPMMYISLSYDHRIIDGKESVEFIVHVKSLLENPKRMLLEI